MRWYSLLCRAAMYCAGLQDRSAPCCNRVALRKLAAHKSESSRVRTRSVRGSHVASWTTRRRAYLLSQLASRMPTRAAVCWCDVLCPRAYCTLSTLQALPVKVCFQSLPLQGLLWLFAEPHQRCMNMQTERAEHAEHADCMQGVVRS